VGEWGAVDPNVKVDEILANIRKSIDSDIETLGGASPSQQRGTLMRDALRDMRATMSVEAESKPVARSADVSDLRSRIRKKLEALEDQAATTRVPVLEQSNGRNSIVPTHKAFTGILSGPSLRGPTPLRPSFVDDDPQDDVRYLAPAHEPQQDWSEDPYTYEQNLGPDVQAQADEAYFGYEQQAYMEGLPSPLMSPHTEAHAETAFRQLSDTILARATGDRSLEEMTREMLKTMLKQWLDANLPTIVEEMVREEIQRVARRGR
jgi:cell pole-organizing protein PopZ